MDWFSKETKEDVLLIVHGYVVAIVRDSKNEINPTPTPHWTKNKIYIYDTDNNLASEEGIEKIMKGVVERIVDQRSQGGDGDDVTPAAL